MDALPSSSSLLTSLHRSARLRPTTDATTLPSLTRKNPTRIPTTQAVRTEEKQQPPPSSAKAPTTATPTSPPASTAPDPPTHAARKRTPLPSSTAPPSLRSLPATLCNALDGIINSFIDPPLRPSVDPRNVLSDNFAPVSELPPTRCPVVRGSIPACLGGGAYIRNGPNPQHLPRGPHHLFDGDGMLHSILLPEGGGRSPATLCSRYVHTYKYVLEREAGAPVLPSVFSGFYSLGGIARGAVTAARVITGQMNPAEGVGLANTSLAYFGGRLFALGESDLPYAVHVSPNTGEVSTVGRCDFNGKLFMGMTAHPKKDPDTGDVFAFRYGPVPPFLTYFWFDGDGNKQPDVPIFSLDRPSFLHDFAVTRRYAVFSDMQIVMKPMDMVFGDGSPVGSDPGKVPRIGVMPRYATSESEMRWFDVPGFNPVHIINAWEEDGGDAVVLVAPNILSVEHALERMELVHSCVEMVRIDLRTGTVVRAPLSTWNLDFGVINPAFSGRKNRFAYLGVGDPMPKISGVVKLDYGLTGNKSAGNGWDCVVASRQFGPGCFGGEPFFVANKKGGIGDGDGDGDGEEDDGYLVSYVHDEVAGESRFVVMDAKSPVLEVVAEVLLPRRVPYGFHGMFVGQEELRSQGQGV